MANEEKKFHLPGCGLYIGSGVYPSSADYLLSVLLGHHAWQGQGDGPLEMIDKIVNDNQGNLAQVWGYGRGYSARSKAEWFYALDEIGIEIPQPDWKKGTYLSEKECQEIKDHADRFGAGLIRFIREAAKRDIYTTFIYTSATPEWSAKLANFGNRYLGYDFGEAFTFRLDEATLKEKDFSKVTLTELADDLIGRVKKHVDERRSAGWGNIMATSCNFYIDYEVLGGADIPLIEDFAFSHLNMASALSRGLTRQHDLPAWGSHLAHEHYSWIPNASKYKFQLFKAALYQKYMTGSKIIINESGNWFVEATLCEDSPKHDFPRVPLEVSQVKWGGDGASAQVFAPFIDEARKLYHTIDYSSPICRRYRKEISDFYDFVKANGTPAGQPESTIAVAKGNYDLCDHTFNPSSAIAGTYAVAEINPNWWSGAPERGWNAVKKAFYPLLPVLGKHVNRFLSGSPYGMVDIVSFAKDQVGAEVLNANYKALLFSGWNTSSDKQYGILKEYVFNGGTLFISIPHLSTNITRNYCDYSVEELVQGGDFSDLCGVKVRGKGRRFYWATTPYGSEKLGFKFPRRFGVMATPMGDIEITDPDAEILVVDDEQGDPLLLRRRYGKGTVYFLNSWYYPGALNVDQGPGSTIDSPGLIGMIYQYIASANRGTVWITDDGSQPGSECNYVTYSYFPETHQICLLNVDFDNPHRFNLHTAEKQWKMDLDPGEFRLLSLDATNADGDRSEMTQQATASML